MADLKSLLRAALAACAPALAAFVTLISTSVVFSLDTAGLGRMGVTAAGVTAACLAYLLWRGRWWAGLPALAIYAWGAAFFLYKFIRPLAAYLAANPVNNLGDLASPLLLLSPSLVLVMICVILGVAVLKGVRLCRVLAPRTVPLAAWGALILWLLILGGDYVYEQAGWRWLKSPTDLVVRLCLPDRDIRKEAQGYLLDLGPDAVPALLAGMAVKDQDLGCMRQGSWAVLYRIGAPARPALLEAARAGSLAAVAALQGLGDRRAAQPLLDIYRDPKRKSSPAFEAALKEAIEKLDPGIHLD